MTSHKSFFFLSTLFLVIMYSTQAMSIGVSPSRTHIPYTPGQPQHGSFTIYNDAHTPLIIDITMQGPLAPFITIDTPSPLQPQTTQQITYTLHIPADFPRSTADTTLFITQSPDDTTPPSTIATRIQLTTHILLSLPALTGYTPTPHDTSQTQALSEDQEQETSHTASPQQLQKESPPTPNTPSQRIEYALPKRVTTAFTAAPSPLLISIIILCITTIMLIRRHIKKKQAL